MKKKLWTGCIVVLLCAMALGMTSFAASGKSMKNKKWISAAGGIYIDEDKDGIKEEFKLYDTQYYKIKIPRQGYMVVDVKASSIPGVKEYDNYWAAQFKGDGEFAEGTEESLDVGILNSKKKELKYFTNLLSKKKDMKFSWAVKKGTYSISTINLAATMEPIVNNILGSVTASWRKVPSAEGYLVYRTEGKAGENRKLLTIAEAGETTYTDNTVIPGTFYTYEIIPYLGTEFGTCDNAITVCAKAENPGEGTEQPGIDSPVTFSIEPFANLDYTFQTIDGDTVSSKVLPTKDVTLLVFGRTTCASSWLTLRSIAESSWVHDPKVSVIYVDIEGADAEVIRSSIDYYAQLSEDASQYYLGCEKIVFCQDADGKNDEARKMYHTLSGKWGTISLPMTILVDKKNIVREMLTGYQIADKILPVMNQVIVKGNAAEEEDKKGDTDKDDTDKDDTGTGDTGNDNTGTGDSQKQPIAVKAEQVRLSKTNLTFNGKAQKPSVIARDSQGRQINSADYTVTYSNNINVGQATATIIFKNNYTGTVKKTFLIMPKGTNISRLTPKKKGLIVKWKKQSSQISGYEIQYSTNRNFKGAKTIRNTKAKTVSKKISGLKAKKRYYVRIRTYKTTVADGRNLKLYSGWSKVKSVKTKK